MFKKENRMTSIFVLVILVFVGLAVWGSVGKDKGEEVKNLPVSTDKEFVLNEQPVLGDKDAPVEMMVFTDFQCPHCKEWSDSAFPDIKSQLLDTGKAKLVFVNYAFMGTPSTYAAMASEYVYRENPEQWYEFNKELYANQSVLTNTLISKLAAKYVDATEAEIKNKLEKEQIFVDDVLADSKKADEMKVTGTPSVFINGELFEDKYSADSVIQYVNGLASGVEK